MFIRRALDLNLTRCYSSLPCQQLSISNDNHGLQLTNSAYKTGEIPFRCTRLLWNATGTIEMAKSTAETGEAAICRNSPFCSCTAPFFRSDWNITSLSRISLSIGLEGAPPRDWNEFFWKKNSPPFNFYGIFLRELSGNFSIPNFPAN
jgi:hypothetical protein